MKNYKPIALAAAVCAVAAVVWAQQSAPAAKIKPNPGQQSFEERIKAVKAAEGKPLPNFEMKRLDDTTLTNKDLKGKVVVFDFWATW